MFTFSLKSLLSSFLISALSLQAFSQSKLSGEDQVKTLIQNKDARDAFIKELEKKDGVKTEMVDGGKKVRFLFSKNRAGVLPVLEVSTSVSKDKYLQKFVLFSGKDEKTRKEITSTSFSISQGESSALMTKKVEVALTYLENTMKLLDKKGESLVSKVTNFFLPSAHASQDLGVLIGRVMVAAGVLTLGVLIIKMRTKDNYNITVDEYFIAVAGLALVVIGGVVWTISAQKQKKRS